MNLITDSPLSVAERRPILDILENYKDNYYPPKEQVFRAFTECDDEATKVVILGQDPYHTPGMANGLAFDIQPFVKRPPSLVNIFQEMYDDLGSIPKEFRLTHLPSKGVLLMNTALTVEEKSPLSHAKQWEPFTKAMIERLNEIDNIVWILWGNHARSYKTFITNETHKVIESAHPSPLSARRGSWGQNLFPVVTSIYWRWDIHQLIGQTMKYPYSTHPYFQKNPKVFQPRKDKVSISFGEEVKHSLMGKYQVNKPDVVRLINNKTRLLQKLEESNVAVPLPIHPFSEFMENNELNIQAFDDVMEFPVQARRAGRTVLIENYRDLLELQQDSDWKQFAIHGFGYQEFTRGSISISPKLYGQEVKGIIGMVKDGVISAEGVQTNVLLPALEITKKVAKVIKFDIGTVELIFCNEEIIVENVKLDPTPEIVEVVDAVISAVIRDKNK